MRTDPYASEFAEEWRDVPNFPGYRVSSVGRVRNALTGMMLRPWPDKNGYATVCLSRKMLRVHRLVCHAFHGPAPSDRQIVAHLDGSRTNNTPSNLMWASNWENSQHSIAHGVMRKGESAPSSKLTEADVLEIWRSTESSRQIAERKGVRPAAITDIRSRKTWRHVTEGLVPSAWPKLVRFEQFPTEVLFDGSINEAAKRLGVAPNTIVRHRRQLLAQKGV